MPIPDGAVFAGYTIVRLLGIGGMGEVYLVQHPRLPRLEALKILPPNVSADPEYRQRFAREADIAASLWHPHIVAVHDRGEFDGQLWIAMDYVDGTDAARLIRDRYPYGMPSTDAFEIVYAIADALDYAHERSLLHRDVKPANILITDFRMEGRRILLSDFGIAKAANDSSGLTATNMTVGSVAYAAPEQLTGKVLDGRADQYALACTAFHLLTGAPPFASSNPAVVISGHLSAPPPRIGARRTDLASVEHVLAKGMAKEPFERFDTCREFAAALAQGDVPATSSAAETQAALGLTAPVSREVSREQESAPRAEAALSSTNQPGAAGTAATTRSVAIVAIILAGLLSVGLVAFIGARLAQPPPQTAPTVLPQPTPEWPEPQLPRQPQTVTRTATVTQRPAPPSTSGRPPAPPQPRRLPGDLGLAVPMTAPACNGQGIVILGNVTTPGMYAGAIQEMLKLHPGASYLRTDQSCPSLRQADDEGDPIYAVFRPAGKTEAEVCSAVRAAGGVAYGKWLDTTTDPSYIIPC